MTVTIEALGHAGYLVSNNTHTIAIDPFLTGNPLANKEPDDIKCSHIAITHGHADHYGPDTLHIAKNNNATVHAPFEICTHLQELGHEAVEPTNPGGRVKTPFGFIALTHAVHSSANNEGRYLGAPAGVIINIENINIYHAGDTDLFSDMKLIADTYQPQIAILPVGDRFTMGPELANQAAKLINAPVVIPCHYATFPLLLTDISAFKPEGIEVRELKTGQTTTIDA